MLIKDAQNSRSPGHKLLFRSISVAVIARTNDRRKEVKKHDVGPEIGRIIAAEVGGNRAEELDVRGVVDDFRHEIDGKLCVVGFVGMVGVPRYGDAFAPKSCFVFAATPFAMLHSAPL